MTEDIGELLDEIWREATRADFPVDTEVYQRSGRDPTRPILFAGSLDVPICIVGRDLGKDEVRAGQPLIGAAGRLVRSGIIHAWEQSQTSKQSSKPHDPEYEGALQHVLLTNTVPFKPIGNKAYSHAIRERFRPFLERFLVNHWKGQNVITLGTQAFAWFAPYGDDAEIKTAGMGRFDMAFRCTLPACNNGLHLCGKPVTVYPLPHPSPLNRRWYAQFPGMLAARLNEVKGQLA
jgi:uracil-DNA glycosylase